jgi:hypothetical protein
METGLEPGEIFVLRFGMIGAFCGSSRQAVDSAKPFVALSLPQKAEETLCVF